MFQLSRVALGAHGKVKLTWSWMYLDARCALNAPPCLVNYISAWMYGKQMPGFVFEFIGFVASSINLKSLYIYVIVFVSSLKRIAFQRHLTSVEYSSIIQEWIEKEYSSLLMYQLKLFIVWLKDAVCTIEWHSAELRLGRNLILYSSIYFNYTQEAHENRNRWIFVTLDNAL